MTFVDTSRRKNWQGGPLSPMLFNIVRNILAIVIVGAKDDEKIKRLFPQLVDGDLFFIRQ
jgi:hypothetical protein